MNDDAGGATAMLGDIAEDTISRIGMRIRDLRRLRGMTLQDLARVTGLSPSMLSLVERGKTSPSIGSLIVVCSALDVHMADLLAPAERVPTNPVSRFADQPVVRTSQGVLRRILRDDRSNDIEIAINEYEPGTASAPSPVQHAGFEYGVLLEGTLSVEVDGRCHVLQPGDLISYPSVRPHRIWNHGHRRAKALWINLHRD